MNDRTANPFRPEYAEVLILLLVGWFLWTCVQPRPNRLLRGWAGVAGGLAFAVWLAQQATASGAAMASRLIVELAGAVTACLYLEIALSLWLRRRLPRAILRRRRRR